MLTISIGRHSARNKSPGRASREPVWRPQDRYHCSDRRLFGQVGRDPVTVISREGDTLTGAVVWVGRWEFGLTVKNAQVTVFRHAMALLETR